MAKRRARPPARLTKPQAQFLALERVCRVATAGAGGRPHLVPVCHVVAGGKVYFASGDDARKVENLRENPLVTVTCDIYSDHWATLKGVMVQGRARLIERGPRFQRVRKLLYRKYPQYPREAAISPSDSVIVEVTPVRVFTWGFD
jgi:PPOX class probable F420-dependent enzyme